MIFKEQPKDWNQVGEASGCFIECDGKFLMLRRAKPGWGHGMWALPAGSIESGETPLEAIVRESYEEAGIKIKSPDFYFKLFIKFTDQDWVFNVFGQKIEKPPIVTLNHEHSEYVWFTPEESLNQELPPEQDNVIKLFYNI